MGSPRRSRLGATLHRQFQGILGGAPLLFHQLACPLSPIRLFLDETGKPCVRGLRLVAPLALVPQGDRQPLDLAGARF